MKFLESHFEDYIRENKKFNLHKELTNIFKQDPGEFGIEAGDLTTDQIAERLAGFMFKQQRSLFEHSDFNKVKLGVANFLARNPGQGFELTDPYVASADMFNREKQLSVIAILLLLKRKLEHHLRS